MSWSIAMIGEPKNVITALTANSEKLTGQSRVEFDEALPHLIGLVSQNFAEPQNVVQKIRLRASGSGYSVDGVQKNRSLNASIENEYIEIV
jgi:hypothetical protein